MSLLTLLRGSRSAPEPSTPMRVVSEPVDDSLYVTLTHASGRKSRWAGDEPEASGIPQNIEISTSAPGGFKSCGMSLTRDPRRAWADLGLLDDIVVEGRTRPLGRSAFEGQMDAFPGEIGDTFSIGVDAVGYQVLLEENESWRAVYVDRDLSHWGPPTLARRIQLNNAGIVLDVDYNGSADGGGISFSGVTGKTVPANSGAELWYRMPPGQSIASIDYSGTERNATNVVAPALIGATDDVATTFGTTALTLDNTVRTATPAARYRYGVLSASAAAAHVPTAQFLRSVTTLAVYGDTGVPLQSIPGSPRGVYGHDALAHMLATGAPLLNFRVGLDGTIWPSEYVVPQLAFPNIGKVVDAVQHLNAYFLRNWAVWEARSFWWTPWSTDTLTWIARINGGARWTPAGADASGLVNGVIVSYTDPFGIPRTAGPPGSGADDETALLIDPRDANAATSHSRRKWARLDVGFPLTNGPTGSAVQLGFVWLQEQMRPQRSGTLVLSPLGPGHIPQLEHPIAGPMPAWACRAGDYIDIPDYPDGEPFRIIDSRYSHEAKQLTLSLDNSSARVSAILERLDVHASLI